MKQFNFEKFKKCFLLLEWRGRNRADRSDHDSSRNGWIRSRRRYTRQDTQVQVDENILNTFDKNSPSKKNTKK